jgi:hypothetical protein
MEVAVFVYILLSRLVTILVWILLYIGCGGRRPEF